MNEENNATLFATMFVIAIIVFIFTVPFAHAFDRGQSSDPETKAWFESLRQPDAPQASCCGVADGYWCDQLHTREGKNYCNITDDRVIPGRTPAAMGLEIPIPDEKMMTGKQIHGSNPTGHSIVFLSSGLSYVYCFVLDSGT